MKELMNRYSDGRRNQKLRRLISVERMLFTAFVVTFVLLLGVQAILLNPETRASVAIQDAMEGTPLGLEEYLYNEGKLGLQLINEERNSLVKVLVNGEEVISFENDTLEVWIVQGDVVEIDGSMVDYPVEVAISSVSDNVDKSLMGKIYKTEGNVVKIGKIRMDE